MLGIFLGILKWLGILLLVLLGLVLTVLLAVLFVPVRYEAEGSFRGELLAKGQISWLWRLFSIQAVYDGDTEVSLRIFGVKPGRKKETAERTEKTETPDPVVTGSGKRPEEEVPVYESRPKAEVPASEKHQGTEEGIKEKVPAAGTKNAKNGQKKKRVRQSLFQKIKVTFQRICGKLKTAEEKWQKLRDFLEKEENKKYYIDAILASGWNATVEAIMKTGFQYLPGTLGYPYSKLAMNYYTAYLQKSFASKKIRVNAVLPGSTDTGMKSEFTEMAHGEEGLLLHCGYANRLAYSKEMAGPIVFLNSEMATYASGVLMEVDYGNTVEERANIKPVQQVISLEDIYQMMQKQSK